MLSSRQTEQQCNDQTKTKIRMAMFNASWLRKSHHSSGLASNWDMRRCSRGCVFAATMVSDVKDHGGGATGRNLVLVLVLPAIDMVLLDRVTPFALVVFVPCRACGRSLESDSHWIFARHSAPLPRRTTIPVERTDSYGLLFCVCGRLGFQSFANMDSRL